MTTEDRIIALANEILEEARTSTDISYRAEMLAALQHACDILAADRGDRESVRVISDNTSARDETGN